MAASSILPLLAFLGVLKENEGKPEPPPPGGVTTSTAPPGTTPAMPAWGGGQTPVPASLPPFPGPGWVPDLPLSSAVTNRAAFWNPQLWDVQKKTIAKPMVQEQFGGRWLTFVAAWHPGKDGPQTFMATEAYRLASDAPLPQATTPVVMPPPAANPAAPAGASMPAALGPEPIKGAWKTSAAWITKYQAALTFLAASKAKPAWDPKGVDGKYGPNTGAAVTAFQKDHPVLKADGQCGTQTAAAIDQELGYGSGPQPQPAPSAQAPVVPPGPAAKAPAPPPAAPAAQAAPAPATPAPGVPPGPLPPPAAVMPYPGPGAWQTNADYIRRYQSALTYIAAAHFCPCDPQGVDGKFGPNTKLAVMAFQKDAQLPQDGEMGPATANALDQAVQNVARAAPAATSGEEVIGFTPEGEPIIGRRHRGKHRKRPAPPKPPQQDQGDGGDGGGGDGGGGGGDGGGGDSGGDSPDDGSS